MYYRRCIVPKFIVYFSLGIISYILLFLYLMLWQEGQVFSSYEYIGLSMRQFHFIVGAALILFFIMAPLILRWRRLSGYEKNKKSRRFIAGILLIVIALVSTVYFYWQGLLPVQIFIILFSIMLAFFGEAAIFFHLKK